MPFVVTLQTNFGAPQTNVQWQRYDKNGLQDTPSSVGLTNSFGGIYSVALDIADGGPDDTLGVQWTCGSPNIPSLTRQQDTTVYSAIGRMQASIDALTANMIYQTAILYRLDKMTEVDPGVGEFRYTGDALVSLLKHDMSAVTGESARSLLNAIRFLRNKWSVSAGNILTVTKEDDATPAWTAAVTPSPGADPIVGTDPT